MTTARAALLLAASVVLGAGLPWGALGLRPDLPLIAVLVVASRMPGPRALVLAAAAGLLEDAIATTPLGVHAAAFAIVAYLLAWLGERMVIEALPVRALLLLAGPWACDTLVRALLHLLVREPFTPGSGVDPWAGLATLAVGLLAWRAPRPMAAARRA